jgi:hypothetical protein
MSWAQINPCHTLTLCSYSYFNIIISFSCCLITSSFRRTKSGTHFPFLHKSILCNTSRGFYSDVASGSVIMGRHSRSSPTAHPATQRDVSEELSLCPRCDQLSDIWREVQIVRCFTVAVNGEYRLTKGSTVGGDCKQNMLGSCVECLPCRKLQQYMRGWFCVLSPSCSKQNLAFRGPCIVIYSYNKAT